MIRTRCASIAAALVILSIASTVGAFGEKEALSELDALVFISPELRVVEWSTDAEGLRATLPR